MDGFSSIGIDDLVEVWVLVDMYHLEGLKLSCVGLLEMHLSENNVGKILEDVEKLNFPCDGLRSICRYFLNDRGDNVLDF